MIGQSLTEKRRKAIMVYVRQRTDSTLDYTIELTLKAERMRADVLYDWLKKRGWHWRRGAWRQ